VAPLLLIPLLQAAAMESSGAEQRMGNAGDQNKSVRLLFDCLVLALSV